jgi:SET domain-containing protein
MLLVDCYVDQSGRHGLGLFAARPIKKGTSIWTYREPADRRKPVKDATLQELHFGYVNPENPDYVVICGDCAEWWNFDLNPNCDLAFPPTKEREADIIAVRDIKANEELTISLDSDHDASRKMKL